MACGGCNSSAAPGALLANIEQQRAVMCAVCPVAWGLDGEKRVCEDNRTIHLHVVLGECHRGHFPSAGGVLRWLGLAWYGVPAPVRWWARWFHRSHRPVKWWSGCGCIRPIKDAWVRLRGGRNVGIL